MKEIKAAAMDALTTIATALSQRRKTSRESSERPSRGHPGRGLVVICALGVAFTALAAIIVNLTAHGHFEATVGDFVVPRDGDVLIDPNLRITRAGVYQLDLVLKLDQKVPTHCATVRATQDGDRQSVLETETFAASCTVSGAVELAEQDELLISAHQGGGTPRTAHGRLTAVLVSRQAGRPVSAIAKSHADSD